MMHPDDSKNRIGPSTITFPSSQGRHSQLLRIYAQWIHTHCGVTKTFQAFHFYHCLVFLAHGRTALGPTQSLRCLCAHLRVCASLLVCACLFLCASGFVSLSFCQSVSLSVCVCLWLSVCVCGCSWRCGLLRCLNCCHYCCINAPKRRAESPTACGGAAKFINRLQLFICLVFA